MQRRSDRWVAIALAVLLHALLLAAVTYGWWKYRRPSHPAPQLAIEATVVDARTVAGMTRPQPVTPPAPAPQPAPAPPPEAVGPPPPTAEELARRDAQQKEAEQAAADKAQAEKQRLEDQQAQERAAQEKAAQAKQAEEKRKAEAQRQADAQDKSEREDLKRSLAAEQRVDTAASSSALASWRSQITAKITRAWLRPPTARQGLECNLYVTQVPGGEVTEVRVGECNGDQAVRESIEAAVYRASPLPPPPDPALFDRSLKITFKPDLD